MGLRAMARRFRGDPRDFVPRLAPPGGVCAEIGVWKGDFSARILKLARPSKLYLIDPWRYMPAPAYTQARYGGQAGEQEAMDRLYEQVLRRFAAAIEQGVAEVHRCSSAEAAAQFDDASLDWIYIDGNHLYEYVRDDLASFDPKVKAGGVIAGDDYGVEGWWQDGVTRAADEFVAARRYEVVSFDAHQFVLRTSPP